MDMASKSKSNCVRASLKSTDVRPPPKMPRTSSEETNAPKSNVSFTRVRFFSGDNSVLILCEAGKLPVRSGLPLAWPTELSVVAAFCFLRGAPSWSTSYCASTDSIDWSTPSLAIAIMRVLSDCVSSSIIFLNASTSSGPGMLSASNNKSDISLP